MEVGCSRRGFLGHNQEPTAQTVNKNDGGISEEVIRASRASDLLQNFVGLGPFGCGPSQPVLFEQKLLLLVRLGG
jgi:hypothetical protein